MEPLRILIADDHPLFRHGLRTLLSTSAGFEVVGEAATGDEAIALAEALQPDLLLIDIQMPGVNGIEATRQIMLTSPRIRVLVITMFEDDASVFAAMRVGARGYVLKDADKAEILRAVCAIGSGEAIFSPAVANRLIDYFSTQGQAVPREIFPTLTDREREILGLIGQGCANADIARDLGLSVKTVSNYVANICSKLQVADRAQATLRAREAGLA